MLFTAFSDRLYICIVRMGFSGEGILQCHNSIGQVKSIRMEKTSVDYWVIHSLSMLYLSMSIMLCSSLITKVMRHITVRPSPKERA